MPWYAKAAGVRVAAYALSLTDLIPDFVPALGLLDDLMLVPLGLLLVVRSGRSSRTAPDSGSRAGAAAVICVWALAAAQLARAQSSFIIKSRAEPPQFRAV